MQIKTATLLVASALLFGACSYSGPTATSTTPQTNVPATVTVSVTPTPRQNLTELNAELNATVDDGGQADMNQLQKDASGL